MTPPRWSFKCRRSPLVLCLVWLVAAAGVRLVEMHSRHVGIGRIVGYWAVPTSGMPGDCSNRRPCPHAEAPLPISLPVRAECAGCLKPLSHRAPYGPGWGSNPRRSCQTAPASMMPIRAKLGVSVLHRSFCIRRPCRRSFPAFHRGAVPRHLLTRSAVQPFSLAVRHQRKLSLRDQRARSGLSWVIFKPFSQKGHFILMTLHHHSAAVNSLFR